MSQNLHCGIALHAALAADAKAFARGLFLGYQVEEDDAGPVDVLELRDCPNCGCQISRRLGIEARLAQARQARGGNGDQEMIGRCKRALGGDEGAIRSFIDAVTFEALMGPTDADILALQGRAVASGDAELRDDCYEALGYGRRVQVVPTRADVAAARIRCAKAMQSGGAR